jgi:ribosomal protein L37AE/L43A
MKTTICPYCRSKATKIFNISTGFYFCQICKNKFREPGLTLAEQKQNKKK